MINPISYWREKKQHYQYLGKIGKLISFTRINHPPKGFGRLPYYVGIVEFKNKQRKTGQLILEAKEIYLGAKVKGVIRIIGEPEPEAIINYGIKFKIL